MVVLPTFIKQYKSDLIGFLLLLIIFAPLYLLSLYTIPFQINTDEITIMIAEKNILSQGIKELFSLSSYFNFPAAIFLVFGFLGNILGGITLEHMRLLHALSGLLIIFLSYILFRLLFKSSLLSFFASMVLGANHSLLGISRMAMRDNSALLIELASLILLFLSFKYRSLLLGFLGGIFAGIGFYVYHPARIAIIIWTFFLLYYLIRFKRKWMVLVLFTSILGFLLTAFPIILAEVTANNSYAREQLLIFKEGRKLQMEWFHAKDELEGIKINVINGLTTLNRPLSDSGWIYYNLGHGFLDPLTGFLIWLGVFSILTSIFKRKDVKPEEFFVLVGFFIIFFSLVFFITKAPDYTRLLIILPFISYLAIKGLGFTRKPLLILIVTVILFWNMKIFNDFVQVGFKYGNDVGGTARYVEARKDFLNYNFYLAADKIYPYYGWGEQGQWENWIGFFASDNQKVMVLSPFDFMNNLSKPPFSVFMSKSLWLSSKSIFISRYPNYQIHNIKPDGSLIAIEVN